MVKNLPATQETWVLSLSQEDPLEKLSTEQRGCGDSRPPGLPQLLECSSFSPPGSQTGHKPEEGSGGRPHRAGLCSEAAVLGRSDEPMDSRIRENSTETTRSHLEF